MADFNGRFGKAPKSPFDAHRPVRADDDLDLILTCRVPRRVSKVLTVQYDRVIYLLEDTVANRRLIHNYLDVFEYPDGRIEIRVNGAALPCVRYDRLSAMRRTSLVSREGTTGQQLRDDPVIIGRIQIDLSITYLPSH
jgi:hypothetical protein